VIRICDQGAVKLDETRLTRDGCPAQMPAPSLPAAARDRALPPVDLRGGFSITLFPVFITRFRGSVSFDCCSIGIHETTKLAQVKIAL